MIRSYLTLGAAALLLTSCGGGSDGGPTTGDLVVVVSTTGTALDPDGYGVAVTGATTAPASINDTVAFTELSSGAHHVQLTGVAATCVGGSVVHALIPSGGADTVHFSVTCTATTGTLAVKVMTSGVALDPDGYQVTIDAGAPAGVGVNGTTGAAVLAVGGHTVTLSGVVMNCTPDAAGPYSVNITPGVADTLVLGIVCGWPRVAVRLGTEGIGLVNPDGSNQISIPLGAGIVYDQPAWSVGHARLAVHLNSFPAPPLNSVGIVDPATVPIDSVVPDPSQAFKPRWKPDGSSLLELRADSNGAPLGLFSVDLATNGRVKISPDSLTVASADWSPDGTQVALAGWVTTDSLQAERLYVIQANGSGTTRITPDSITGVGYVRWSPAGDRIMFNRNDGVLWTISPTGAGLQKITVAGFDLQTTGTWSPDGAALLIGAVDTSSGGYSLLRISPAGAILLNLPHLGGTAMFDPDWR